MKNFAILAGALIVCALFVRMIAKETSGTVAEEGLQQFRAKDGSIRALMPRDVKLISADNDAKYYHVGARLRSQNNLEVEFSIGWQWTKPDLDRERLHRQLGYWIQASTILSNKNIRQNGLTGREVTYLNEWSRDQVLEDQYGDLHITRAFAGRNRIFFAWVKARKGVPRPAIRELANKLFESFEFDDSAPMPTQQ